jgi:hypothetical protein
LPIVKLLRTCTEPPSVWPCWGIRLGAETLLARARRCGPRVSLQGTLEYARIDPELKNQGVSEKVLSAMLAAKRAN